MEVSKTKWKTCIVFEIEETCVISTETKASDERTGTVLAESGSK